MIKTNNRCEPDEHNYQRLFINVLLLFGVFIVVIKSNDSVLFSLFSGTFLPCMHWLNQTIFFLLIVCIEIGAINYIVPCRLFANSFSVFLCVWVRRRVKHIWSVCLFSQTWRVMVKTNKSHKSAENGRKKEKYIKNQLFYDRKIIAFLNWKHLSKRMALVLK